MTAPWLALLAVLAGLRLLAAVPDALPRARPRLVDGVRWRLHHGSPALGARLPGESGTGLRTLVPAGAAGLFLAGVVAGPLLFDPVFAVVAAASVAAMGWWAVRALAWLPWWTSELVADTRGVRLEAPGRAPLERSWDEVRGVWLEQDLLVIDGDPPWFVPIGRGSRADADAVVAALTELRPPKSRASLRSVAPPPPLSLSSLVGLLPTLTAERTEPEVTEGGASWTVVHARPSAGWAPPRSARWLDELGLWLLLGYGLATATTQWAAMAAVALAGAVAVGASLFAWRNHRQTTVRADPNGVVLGENRDRVQIFWPDLAAVVRTGRAWIFWRRDGPPIVLSVRAGDEAAVDEMTRQIEAARRAAGPALPAPTPEVEEALASLARRAAARERVWR